MKTVTFICSDSDKNMLEYTYPMMIRLKQRNHDFVNFFVKKLGELSSGTNDTFYSMYHKQQMRVHFELIASLGDQPERRGMNYIMGGY